MARWRVRWLICSGPLLIVILLSVVTLDDWLDNVRLSGFWQDLFGGRATLPRGLALFGLIGDVLEAYERLILDAMRGDHTLFTTAQGIERLWEVSTPVL